MKGSFVVRVMVLVLAGVSAPAMAQPDPASPADLPAADLLFGEEIDVRVVNLEVVVEDGSGNRVHGLQADDFRLVVDGLEVGVDYFTEILENRAVEGRDRQTPPAIGDGEAVATNYLLFVDDDHTHVAFRRPVLRGLASQLANLGLRDQVAVVVQSRRRLEVLSPFTSDREWTRDVLEELDRGQRYGGSLRSPQFMERPLLSDDRAAPMLDGQVDENLASAAGDLLFPQMRLTAPMVEAQMEALARDLEFSVTAVSSTMRALDVPTGRKVLLLLAGDWPAGPFRAEGRNIGLRAASEILETLVDTANVLGYTVYPMDQQSGGANWNLWMNLRQIARATGGRTYLRGANIEALRRIAADVANYYWLGFVPEYRRDNREHDVRVEVRRPGLRIRSRRSYLDLSPRAEADMDTQGRLLFPGLVKAPGEPVLRVEFGQPEPNGIRKMVMPVIVHVPIGLFPVVPFEDEFLARLELRFAVVDRNGQQAEIPLIPIHLRGRTRPAADAVMPYAANLTLRRKPHDLVVSIHDPLSRQTVSTRTCVAFRPDGCEIDDPRRLVTREVQ